MYMQQSHGNCSFYIINDFIVLQNIVFLVLILQNRLLECFVPFFIIHSGFSHLKNLCRISKKKIILSNQIGSMKIISVAFRVSNSYMTNAWNEPCYTGKRRPDNALSMPMRFSLQFVLKALFIRVVIIRFIQTRDINHFQKD